jgi:hypothetical protein
MKFFVSILILSIITYANTAATLKALIETAATKTAFATTDEISVKISNTGNEDAPAGNVTGLSLVASSVSKTVALTCAATTANITATTGTATVVCKPAAAESTAGEYVLTASTAKVGDVALTVDTENTKSITISASANTNTTTTTTTNNNTEAGNYQKISFILFAIALLF